MGVCEGLRRAALLALVLGIGLGGCRGEPTTPEEQVRAVIAEVAAAIEAGEVSSAREHISESFESARGHDARELAQLLTFHVMRHQRVSIVTRVHEVFVREPERVEVRAAAASAGRTIAGPEDLRGLRGQIYALELDFALEGDAWKLIFADWRPTDVTDLF